MPAYSPSQDTHEAAVEKARARGLVVRLPKPNELFVDIDTFAAYERFKEQIEVLKRWHRVVDVVESPSASGGAHKHIVVTLGNHVTPITRIALQAMLGSDLKREMLSYGRLLTGSSPHPTLFFERPAGAAPPPAPTGYNCVVCNTRNDYATANQDDGTYVCFECRQ